MPTITLNPTSYTFIDSSTPTTNYGGWIPTGGDKISVRAGTGDASQERITFLKFNISGNVPVTAQNIRATLRLYSYSLSGYTYSASTTMGVYAVAADWNANTLTYNSSLYLGTPTLINGSTATHSGYNTYYEYDISEFVRGVVATTDADHGVCIKNITPASKTTKLFYGNHTTYPIQLVITYGATHNVTGVVGNDVLQSVSVNATTATQGDTIIATMSPKSILGHLVMPDYWTRSDLSGRQATGSSTYSFTMPDYDVTVTAYGVAYPIQYTVVYNGNGADSGSMASQTFTYNVPQNLRLNTFVKAGKTFLGWSIYSQDTTPQYTNGQQVNNLSATMNSTVTLYAIWGAQQYQISVDGDSHVDATGVGISGTPSAGNSISVYISPSSITPGYEVSDWVVNGQSYGKGTYTAGVYSITFVMPSSDVQVFIHTDGKEYSLTLDFNGGTLDGSSTKTVGIKYNTPIATAFVVPTKQGKMITGYTYNDVLVPFGDSQTLYTTLGNTTVTAQYVDAGRVWTLDPTTNTYKSSMRHIYSNGEWTETSR